VIGDRPDLATRLDRIIAILELAHRDQIEAAKRQIREDPINAAILEATAEDWVRSGDLQRDVARAEKTSPRTVRSRLEALVRHQAIAQRGAGTATEYRASGLL
jgi:hypothetical protein